MSKFEVSTSGLRQAWLEQLYICWEMSGGPNDFFHAQQIWDVIRSQTNKEISGPVAEGALNSLLHEGLVKAIDAEDSGLVVRITKNGRTEYLSGLVNDLRKMMSAVRNGQINDQSGDYLPLLEQAANEADNGNRKKAISKLEPAGKWFLDAATKIGTNVAVAAIRQGIGI